MTEKKKSPAVCMRELMDLARIYLKQAPPFLDAVYLTVDGKSYLSEGRKWVSGRFDRNIGIDAVDYGAGTTNAKHAHIHGRKGKELGIVKTDGTSSHGTKFRLHRDDIEALRAQGFEIRDDGLVEWIILNLTDVRFVLNG
jgi:hypothetical protein